MDTERLSRLDRRVPRYTSYPTAPHMHAGIGAETVGRWLAAIPAATPLSLYLHIPFCDTLCWFCGCHTKIVARYAPVAAYLGQLEHEIDLVVTRLGDGRPVGHIHFGGGSPTLLEPADLIRIGTHLRQRFDVQGDAEVAVEIDPRGLDQARVEALAAIGVTRASLGVQDLDPEVQRAINRVQPLADTERVVGWLRAAGIEAINVDLMYGLPGQTEAGVRQTAQTVMALSPARVALFGYAHVPWMKRHQRLLDESALAGPAERLDQYGAVADELGAAGLVAIGLDHFARPDDPLAIAARERRLRRNFQGYTTDAAEALLGFGASAIGALPQGYVQNAVPIHAWRDAVEAGRLPVVRGIAIDAEDRLRRQVIEALMCHLEVDLAEVATRHGRPADHFAPELIALEALAADGLVTLTGSQLEVPPAARPFVRLVAATFDTYLQAANAPGQTVARHAKAI